MPLSSTEGGLGMRAYDRSDRSRLKALVNEDTLLRTHCCPWCFLGCANWVTFVADTKCFWTKSERFFVSWTQNLCPQQMLGARANGETFVSATRCLQQSVLVCQGLKRTDPTTLQHITAVYVKDPQRLFSWYESLKFQYFVLKIYLE